MFSVLKLKINIKTSSDLNLKFMNVKSYTKDLNLPNL